MTRLPLGKFCETQPRFHWRDPRHVGIERVGIDRVGRFHSTIISVFSYNPSNVSHPSQLRWVTTITHGHATTVEAVRVASAGASEEQSHPSIDLH